MSNKTTDQEYLDEVREEARAQITAWKKLRATPVGAKHSQEIIQRAKVAASVGGIFTRLRGTLSNERAMDIMVQRMGLEPADPKSLKK